VSAWNINRGYYLWILFDNTIIGHVFMDFQYVPSVILKAYLTLMLPSFLAYYNQRLAHQYQYYQCKPLWYPTQGSVHLCIHQRTSQHTPTHLTYLQMKL